MDLSWLTLASANARWVLAGAVLLGLSSGVLGSFALLRRRSLMGDALAHAALPGVCIAYLLTGSKHIGIFLAGAAIAGVLGTLTITAITRYSKIKEDAAMGIVLAVYFGIGMMLLSVIQRLPTGNQSGLDKFLFGQAAALVGRDVQVMVVIAAILCLAVLILFKEFKLLAFDRGFGIGLGLPMGLLDLLLNLLIVLAVVIGLQSVGVVLMAAMLITPAIAARYWTERLSLMVVLAGLFGAFSGAFGTLLSQAGPRMPTGPLIVLAATGLFVISMLFAPRRGLVAKLLRHLSVRRQVAREGLLRALYELAEEAGSAERSITAAELVRRKGMNEQRLPAQLRELAGEGLLTADGAAYRLTRSGLSEAGSLVREQRLYEVYLMHQSALGGAVDRDALTIEYPPALRRELEQLMALHGLQPKLAAIQAGKEGA